MKKYITAFAFLLIMPSVAFSQSQKSIDSLQNVRIESLEKRVEPIEDLKNKIFIVVSGFVLLFGGLTLWNVFVNTKKQLESKQNEIIKTSIEENLKNLSTQLGMPLADVRRILEQADKNRLLKTKKILVVGQNDQPNLEIINALKSKGFQEPVFKSLTDSTLNVGGFEVLIINSFDRTYSDKTMMTKLFEKFDNQIQIVCANPDRIEGLDLKPFKSKIQFANSPDHLSNAIEAIFT